MSKPLTPDSLDLASMRSLLVVKPSSLGDVVHTLPAVALIKRAYPQLSIRWVVRSEFMPLLEGNPDLDGTIEFPRREMRGLGGIFKLLRWSKSALREPAVPDLVIDFQGLARSGVMSKRSASKQIIGLNDSREGACFFHKWMVAVDAAGHAVDRYLEVPRALGIDCTEAVNLFRMPEGTMPSGVEFQQEPFVMLHPFSRGDGKSLQVEQVRTLCDELAPLQVVIVGVADETLPKMRDGVIDLLNRTTIAELIAVTRRAGFVISVDSGPMHIAAAISDRLVSIHTWSDPRKVGPYAPDSWVWKGGVIQQVSDYTVSNDPDRLPEPADLKEIAALVKDRL